MKKSEEEDKKISSEYTTAIIGLVASLLSLATVVITIRIMWREVCATVATFRYDGEQSKI